MRLFGLSQVMSSKQWIFSEREEKPRVQHWTCTSVSETAAVQPHIFIFISSSSVTCSSEFVVSKECSVFDAMHSRSRSSISECEDTCCPKECPAMRLAGASRYQLVCCLVYTLHNKESSSLFSSSWRNAA